MPGVLSAHLPIALRSQPCVRQQSMGVWSQRWRSCHRHPIFSSAWLRGATVLTELSRISPQHGARHLIPVGKGTAPIGSTTRSSRTSLWSSTSVSRRDRFGWRKHVGPVLSMSSRHKTRPGWKPPSQQERVGEPFACHCSSSKVCLPLGKLPRALWSAERIMEKIDLIEVKLTEIPLAKWGKS